MDRKAQIVSAAIDRLHAVGFEGFRLGDVAKDVGISNATLIHHYPTKVALIRAVVERFTQTFEAVASATSDAGAPDARLVRHMQSSVTLMRRSPEMFVVLNEIMIRARRDVAVSQLVAVPLKAWQDHIISLILLPVDEGKAAARSEAEEISTACMAQLLGMGLLLNSTDRTKSSDAPISDRTEPPAIRALANLVRPAS